MLIAGLAAVVLGAVVSVALAASASGGPRWSDGLQLIVYMLGAIMVASVLGLIFGVPRAREDSGAPTTERYSANSNLEQISDWLTKVLVGAGLVQLGALTGGLSALGDYLGSDLRIRNAEAAAVAITLYGLGVGFTFAYLWSRVRLRVLLETIERQAREQSRERQVAEALLEANAWSDDPQPESVVTSVASEAAKRTRDAPARARAVLWVDDVPSNNTALVQALRRLGIRVDIARTTQEGVARVRDRRYGVVITDLSRQEDGVDHPDAGLELLEILHTTKPELPVIVYAGHRAVAKRDEIERAGAVLSTNSPTEVFEKVVELLT